MLYCPTPPMSTVACPFDKHRVRILHTFATLMEIIGDMANLVLEEKCMRTRAKIFQAPLALVSWLCSSQARNAKQHDRNNYLSPSLVCLLLHNYGFAFSHGVFYTISCTFFFLVDSSPTKYHHSGSVCNFVRSIAATEKKSLKSVGRGSTLATCSAPVLRVVPLLFVRVIYGLRGICFLGTDLEEPRCVAVLGTTRLFWG
ncbi:hypothetical protein BX600DRAFT_84598 [Xylariales sp. PMI_506]|nr:hypothetical protein BX600DRAFT_84598 [Xylariales sp. PMI_506]